jgi:hypothetical protein
MGMGIDVASGKRLYLWLLFLLLLSLFDYFYG